MVENQDRNEWNEIHDFLYDIVSLLYSLYDVVIDVLWTFRKTTAAGGNESSKQYRVRASKMYLKAGVIGNVYLLPLLECTR